MSGNRIPGTLDEEARSVGEDQPPGGGYIPPGVIGMDAGTPAPAAISLTGWPRNVTWDEFREVPSNPEGGDEDAYISTAFPYTWDWGSEGRTYRVTNVRVTIRLRDGESWVVRGRQSNDLLSHEQGHYDITGLMGRDLAEDLSRVTASSESALKKEVERIAQHYRTQGQALQRQYDNEANHGQNRTEQDRWKRKIQDAIDNGTRLAPRP
jgi:hypothetical protein